MANISALEACKKDLYSDRATLMERYPLATAERVIRIRDMHQMYMAEPGSSCRDIVSEIARRYGVTEKCAYADLRIVKELLPTLTESKRNFARWRANEMMLETYAAAKAKGNVAIMATTAANYAKFNRIDVEDESDDRYSEIVIQPFVPTTDPRVLGIEPIPNLRETIKRLTDKYKAEVIDIQDVKYEEADLQEDLLFPSSAPDSSNDNHDGRNEDPRKSGD